MKYRAYATMTTKLYLDIEADSEDEAWEIAEGRDGGAYMEIENAGDWQIDKVVEKKVFNTTQSDLMKYNGTEVEIGDELTDAERDPEVGRMWHVKFYDGYTGDAFEDELTEVEQ